MEAMAVRVGERLQGHWPAPGTIKGEWTIEDRDALPDDGLRYELIDGALIVSPAPSNRHQRVASALYIILYNSLWSHGDSALEIQFAPMDWRPDDRSAVQPDLIVAPAVAAVDQSVVAPVLLVEVVSPSSQQIDRTLKFEMYERAGVPQYWIVDPGTAGREPSIEVYDLVDGTYRLQVRVEGGESMSVTGPVSLTLTPGSLGRAQLKRE